MTGASVAGVTGAAVFLGVAFLRAAVTGAAVFLGAAVLGATVFLGAAFFLSLSLSLSLPLFFLGAAGTGVTGSR